MSDKKQEWSVGGNDLYGDHIFDENGEPVAIIDGLPEGQKHAYLIAAAPDLRAAVDAQHKAIDLLMAMLMGHDKTFMPSKSTAWAAVEMGHAALKKASRQ